MPTRSNDTSAFTARQVLYRAITALDNLSLLLQEAETLAYCASLSLDALPWTGSNPDSFTPGTPSPDTFTIAGPGAPRVGTDLSGDSASRGPSTGSGSGASHGPSTAGSASPEATGDAFPEAARDTSGRSAITTAAKPDSTNIGTASAGPDAARRAAAGPEIVRSRASGQDDDFDLDDLDEIIDSMADLESGDLTASSDASGSTIPRGFATPGTFGVPHAPGVPGMYDAEDRSLAAGRLHTLVIAESKASRRTLLYCQRVRRALSAAMARLPRPEPRPPSSPPSNANAASDPGSFSQPWLRADSEP